MKIDWLKITLVGYLSFSLLGCNQIATPAAPNDTTAPASPQGDSTPMNSNSPTPAVSGLDNLIEKAKADLAQQLAISVTEINLTEATSVTWSDSSLGCPQEGMVYAQVLTPGYLILLEHGGNTFEYHASTSDSIITCENPFPPVPDIPNNT